MQYRATSAYGHFGRERVAFDRLVPGKPWEVVKSTSTFTWERTDRAAALAAAVKG